MSGPSVGQVSNIAGSNRPEAAGHRFGPDLTCIECGKTWDAHQADPAVCTPAHEPKATFVARIDDGH